ncbi:unnamed protein product [Peronospora effusa]|nr:unnamed protein product [Peronospora effusa]
MADNLRVVVVVEHVAIEYGMDSIEEGFEHEKTVEKDLGEEDAVCRDPTRYVRLFAVKVVYKSKLGSINGIDGHGNTMREAKRLLTEKRYCPGGDMYFLHGEIREQPPFKGSCLFYATSFVLALRYLHERGILYGDLKPENILLDEAGFERLADFGFAREQMHRPDQCCTSFCGLANYNAPEVVRGTGSGLAADLWRFGCVAYELLTGYPPSTLGVIVPCSSRLGSGPNGMQDILDHSFFTNINWHRLETKRVTLSIVPKLASKLDTSNFECQFTSQQVMGHLVYEERWPASIVSDEEDNQVYSEDFDWCADVSHLL